MRKIDRETTQRILDAADIVEVVGDFVSLKRRGANYIGLCPFHNERTPSFSVSKSRGICKCFSCGKGGSPVNFLMELEQMTYQEALRYLARKYGIEIKEREVSEAERQQERERESMMAVNDWAMHYFEDVMADTDEGRDVGMAYFRERGINEAMCRRFHLGYSLERGSDLYKKAIEAGYKEEFLIATGLCSKNDKGVYDRFRGRVIYPVFTVSGRVVAFGGRTLRSDKSMAKYVNSPESVIYSKSRELYGLFQAKQAIVRKNKCILVEGYMDVISMHQSGVENVVASSGTSLTEGQIRLIHRFTENVTVIYDSDAAGVKASLRGIDMLLKEGMNVKVLSLPPGDDPDSYAQNHTNEEVEAYLRDHETDFIRFKSDILLGGDEGRDPIQRAKAIQDIIRSIAVIPDAITRQVYIEECSRRFGMDEKLLSLQVDKYMADNAADQYDAGQRAAQRAAAAEQAAAQQQGAAVQTPADTAQGGAETPAAADKALEPFEHEVLRYVVRYGVMHLCDEYDEEGNAHPMSVLDYVAADLGDDQIGFVNASYAKLFDTVRAYVADEWAKARANNEITIEIEADRMRREGTDKIRNEAVDLSDIKVRENRLQERINLYTARARHDFERQFIVRTLCSDPDDDVRRLANDMAADKYTLSKVHTKYTHIETEDERLDELVPRALYELKNAILTCRITAVTRRIKEESAAGAFDRLPPLLQELMELNNLKGEFAKYLGERIITP